MIKRDESICDLHSDFTQAVEQLIESAASRERDVIWLVRLGKWFLGVCGAGMLIMISLAGWAYIEIAGLQRELKATDTAIYGEISCIKTDVKVLETKVDWHIKGDKNHKGNSNE